MLRLFGYNFKYFILLHLYQLLDQSAFSLILQNLHYGIFIQQTYSINELTFLQLSYFFILKTIIKVNLILVIHPHFQLKDLVLSFFSRVLDFCLHRIINFENLMNSLSNCNLLNMLLIYLSQFS